MTIVMVIVMTIVGLDVPDKFKTVDKTVVTREKEKPGVWVYVI